MRNEVCIGFIIIIFSLEKPTLNIMKENLDRRLIEET